MNLETRPRTGTLLIANPTLLDRNFSRTVVLLCAHASEGSMGLILNRPSAVTLAEVLVGVPASARDNVHWGGPVEPDRFILLQRLSPEDPGQMASRITTDVGFGDEEEFMRDLTRESPRALARYRLFAGYAGWGEGQLQGEMDECSWLVASIPVGRFVFETTADAMWSTAIAGLGPEYAHLVNLPLDPRVN